MARKGGGSAGGGAHLASGFIELHIKYASAMGQIASDFDTIDKRAKSTGESITKSLVQGADKAKAQVQELGSAYEAQRSKVASLKAEVQQLQAANERAAAAEKASADARRAYAEQQHANTQRAVTLQEQLNAAIAKVRDSMGGKKASGDAIAAAVKENAAVQTIYKQQAALEAKRKKDLQDITRFEKEATAARSAASSPAAAQAQKTYNTELAKGRELLEKYGQAVQDANRKQQLANTTITQAANEHRTFGQRISQAFSGTFVPQMQAAGTKGVNAFRQAFNKHMTAARSDSEHHGRNIASGLLMGLTPQFLTAAGAGLALGAAFKSGFSRLEDIDTAKLKLEALGYTAADISATTGAAMDSVIGTAYSFSDAMNAATVAMAAGIKPGADLQKHLTLIADAAALTGEDYGTMAETINRVTQFGGLSAREMRPLISHNIPVLQWLREYYVKQTGNQKITISDIRDMITKKMVTADVFEKVMGEHMAGMAKELGRKTVTGAFKNMWVQVGKVTASLIEPIFGSIPGAINKVADTLSRWSENLKPIMSSAVEWIKKKWADIQPALGKAVDWIKKTWAALWPHVQFYIDKFVTMWKEMWPQLMDHVKPLLGAFRRLWDALWPIVKPFVALAGVIAYEFIKHLPAIAQFTSNLINWLATAVEWLRVKFWPWLKDHWKSFREDVTKAWGEVKTFSDKVIGFFDAIKTGTEKTWTWLENKFKWMKDHIPGLTLLLKAFGLSGDSNPALASYSSPLVQGAGGNVPMPAGLIDTEGKHSGPQARYVAGLVMQQFGIDHVGGARASGTAKGTHDTGTSIDIPIGSSAEERAKGDRINAWLQANAKSLGIYYTIWKDKGTNMVDNPSGGAGTTFNQPGHQDHIDVHFDGKTFGATGSNGSNYNISPVSSSHALSGQDNQLAAALKAQGFNDSQIVGLIALNNVETGNWAHPESIMGFTNQQTGPGISAHVGGFKGMWDRRQASGAVSGVGSPDSGMDAAGNVVDPNRFAAWLLKLEGYSATQDWRGNQYAPGQFLAPSAYASQVSGAYGPRRVSTPVANMDFSRPIMPWEPGYRSPDTNGNPLYSPFVGSIPESIPNLLTLPSGSAAAEHAPVRGLPFASMPDMPLVPVGQSPFDIMQGSSNPVAFDTPQHLVNGQPESQPKPERLGGPGFWGNVQSFIQNDSLTPQWVKELLKPRTISILPDTDLPGHKAFDSIAADAGLPISALQPRFLDTGAGHNAANQNLHRGINGPLGPKGTKDDPVVTTDPKVTENTDPNNQPGTPGGPDLVDANGNPIDAGGSGGGVGGSAGAAVGVDENGNPVDANGNPAKDVATGLGDVASKAFSDQFAGTPFSDPTQWPATQSAGALLKFFGGLLTGSGGEGLGGLFGPGGKGKGPSSISRRNAQDALRKKDDAIAKAKAKLADMKDKPQFTDEAIQEQQDKVDSLLQDRETIVANAQDRGISLGTDDAASGGPSGWGPGKPFGPFTPGSPPPAPGGPAAGGAIAPGGGWLGGSLPTGMIPTPADVQPAAPVQQGGDVNITTNQQISGDPVEAETMAQRSQNTTLNSQFLALKTV